MEIAKPALVFDGAAQEEPSAAALKFFSAWNRHRITEEIKDPNGKLIWEPLEERLLHRGELAEIFQSIDFKRVFDTGMIRTMEYKPTDDLSASMMSAWIQGLRHPQAEIFDGSYEAKARGGSRQEHVMVAGIIDRHDRAMLMLRKTMPGGAGRMEFEGWAKKEGVWAPLRQWPLDLALRLADPDAIARIIARSEARALLSESREGVSMKKSRI